MNPQTYLSTDEQSLDLKLTGRMQDISVEMNQLAGRGELDELQERHVDTLSSEFTNLEGEQKKLHLDARTRYISESAVKGTQVYRGDSLDSDPFGEPDSIENRAFKDPWNLDEMRAYPYDGPGRAAEVRARAFSAIEKMAGTTQARREAMTTIIEKWDDSRGRIAEMALVTSSPAYMSFWAKRLRFGNEAALTPEENEAAQRAMSLTDASGGYLIPFQLDTNVIWTADGSLNQIRQIARQVIATGDVWSGVSSAGVTWSWDAESEEVSDDAATFAQPQITIHAARGFVPISIEALQDEANVTSAIGEQLANGKDVLDAAAFATGSGTGEPVGIVTALTGTASIATSVTTDVLDDADAYKVHAALPARYRARSSWLANNAFYNEMRQDSATQNAFWEGIGGDRPATLLGRPVYESEDMDSAVGAGVENYMAVIGDFSNYVIADRMGMQVETIPHLFGTPNNRPTGNRGFFAMARTGADSVNDGAFSMLNVT